MLSTQKLKQKEKEKKKKKRKKKKEPVSNWMKTTFQLFAFGINLEDKRNLFGKLVWKKISLKWIV